uniref:Uncharacterized protein n=1 Tax=Chrysotila carterae TaxID=13221 RepID=A0A7S4F960_CHRCT
MAPMSTVGRGEGLGESTTQHKVHSAPWLSKDMGAAELTAEASGTAAVSPRVPKEMRVVMAQLERMQMKGDMEAQMLKVIEGFKTERPLVNRFKSEAIDLALAAHGTYATSGGGPSTVDMLKQVRAAANEQCDLCLSQLHGVARAELIRAQEQQQMERNVQKSPRVRSAVRNFTGKIKFANEAEGSVTEHSEADKVKPTQGDSGATDADDANADSVNNAHNDGDGGERAMLPGELPVLPPSVRKAAAKPAYRPPRRPFGLDPPEASPHARAGMNSARRSCSPLLPSLATGRAASHPATPRGAVFTVTGASSAIAEMKLHLPSSIGRPSQSMQAGDAAFATPYLAPTSLHQSSSHTSVRASPRSVAHTSAHQDGADGNAALDATCSAALLKSEASELSAGSKTPRGKGNPQRFRVRASPEEPQAPVAPSMLVAR